MENQSHKKGFFPFLVSNTPSIKGSSGYCVDVVPACPESFFVFKKDSRRASLAGMTALGDRDCHIAPLLTMMLSKGNRLIWETLK